ncbi:MAG: urea carboxylase-associated family protein [Candidatus Eremiobacteraeota bacterium]|nr:urea carboxylase-associated family protein [Candidatus Eremiobacteraeota bacterium]MBC5826371.1 urea carboxylase-associated family protein [Candidatus Eremiobacteraeota bacterium]
MEVSVSPLTRISAQSGCAFTLAAGQRLDIVDPQGRQVADLAIFARADVRERFSAGRTLDYNEKLYLSVGDVLYSNRSSQLLEIEIDEVGRHDYLLSPCSRRMFELLRDQAGHPSCHANLSAALGPFGIDQDDVDSAFNVFMNVAVSLDGTIAIRPPLSKAGDRIGLRALTDVVIGLTACSSEQTNAGSCKPVDYRICD